MQSKKHGLADLKRLRAHAQAAAAAPEPIKRSKSSHRRRAAKALGKAGQGSEGRSSRGAGPGVVSKDNHAKISASSEPDLISQEDIVLFRRAMKLVQRLKPSGRVILPPPPRNEAVLVRRRGETAPPAKRLRHTVSDEYAPLRQDGSTYLKVGHGPDLLKGLRRGKWPIMATLDLHGSTLDEARNRLDQFIASCVQHNVKCVRIIHGKGHGSSNGQSVLKDTARRWLAQLDPVLAYTECSEQNGGSGAVQALLKT